VEDRGFHESPHDQRSKRSYHDFRGIADSFPNRKYCRSHSCERTVKRSKNDSNLR